MNWWKCRNRSRVVAEQAAIAIDVFSALDLGPLQGEDSVRWGIAKWNGTHGTAMEGFFVGISEQGSGRPYAYADHGGEIEVEDSGPGYSGDVLRDIQYFIDFARRAIAEMEQEYSVWLASSDGVS